MTKIWQTDFTTFSGVTNVLYDLVGTQHLSITSGTLNKVDPLIGFSNRKGMYFSNNGNIQQYVLYAPDGSINLTNARFTAPYTTRSFVLWIYTYTMGNITYWDNTTNTINLWGSYNTGARVDYGLVSPPLGAGIAVLNNQTIFLGSTVALTTGWHCAVVTINRTSPQTKLYIDKYLVGTSTTVVASGSPTVGEVIGDTGGSNEGTFYLGEATTYDHILSQAEVNTIYDTFMVDSITGPANYQTFSGYVYGLNNQVVSGAALTTYHKDTSQVVHETTTSSNGYFQIILPYSGTYVVTADQAPNSGTRSFPVIATSGGVYFP